MEDNRLVEWSYRESPASDPHFGWEVAFPVFAAALAAYGIVWAFVGYKPAMAVAGAVAIVMLFYRLYQFDSNGRGVHIVEHKKYSEDPEPRREWAPVMIGNGENGNGNSHVWTIGHWNFSQSEWCRLWEQVLSKGMVTRDSLATVMLDNNTRMFPNHTGRWREYQTELRRLGWIDRDNAVSDACRAWFADRNLIPLPNEHS